ncbi:hypothetical protein QAD02_013785 [Eretmocerus hayati]|uniref:Uncharacterized protein n=1 Tax=Eretmocerus hayati TaxID=131215 RepID=A0ACC2P4F1_9HYME|nr:hypothetical protein QAD02_013785 [Eretmocerus hayati]
MRHLCYGESITEETWRAMKSKDSPTFARMGARGLWRTLRKLSNRAVNISRVTGQLDYDTPRKPLTGKKFACLQKMYYRQLDLKVDVENRPRMYRKLNDHVGSAINSSFQTMKQELEDRDASPISTASTLAEPLSLDEDRPAIEVNYSGQMDVQWPPTIDQTASDTPISAAHGHLRSQPSSTVTSNSNEQSDAVISAPRSNQSSRVDATPKTAELLDFFAAKKTEQRASTSSSYSYRPYSPIPLRNGYRPSSTVTCNSDEQGYAVIPEPRSNPSSRADADPKTVVSQPLRLRDYSSGHNKLTSVDVRQKQVLCAPTNIANVKLELVFTTSTTHEDWSVPDSQPSFNTTPPSFDREHLQSNTPSPVFFKRHVGRRISSSLEASSPAINR